jgi:protein-S-isoprenylcysteine O-methyltransferase Ste14
MAGRPYGELIRGFVALGVTILIMAALLFVSAGTLDWPPGWWFIAVFVVLILVSMAWLWRANPEIFVARARATGQGTKGWDRALLPILLIAYALIFPVAGLDDGRFHGSSVPFWLVLVGYLLVVAGFAGVGWAEAVNRHFEVSVRIQSERGHTVITTGPYAYIRHPGYIAGSLLALGAAWALGSWWALLPALVVGVTMIVRTKLEDATLRRELPGYAEFAQKTRFKWLPGVW